MLLGHGDDIHTVNKKLLANYSSNIYYNADTTGIVRHLQKCMSDIRNYPEVDSSSLVNAIAKYTGISSEQIIATNGATEAIYLIAQCFKGARSLILVPSFSEYEDACTLNNHTIDYHNNSSALADAAFNNYDCVWICNPNNPDGKIWERKYLGDIIRQNPSTVFVVDESYIEFIECNESVSPYYRNLTNLIIVNSFTKKYSIPGLRLGYLAFSFELCAKLHPFVKPWNVNIFAIEAGKYILDNQKDFSAVLKTWLSDSASLQNKIDSIEGYEVIRTETVFFLVRSLNVKASYIKNRLLEKNSILIRDASNFRGLNDSYFRICSQGREKDTMLIDALMLTSRNNQ